MNLTYRQYIVKNRGRVSISVFYGDYVQKRAEPAEGFYLNERP